MGPRHARRGPARDRRRAAPTWIGHSFGGRLVDGDRRGRPELVQRAVLLDPAIFVPPPTRTRARPRRSSQEASFATVDEAIDARMLRSGLAHTPREMLEEEMRDHLVAGEDGRFRYRYSQRLRRRRLPRDRRRRPAVRGAACSRPCSCVGSRTRRSSAAGEAELYRRALGDLLRVVVVPGGPQRPLGRVRRDRRRDRSASSRA